MTTNTAQSLPPVRQNPRQVINYLRKVVNYNDVGIGSGVAFEGSLPHGAFITDILVEVITAFNAATTNVLTVGTNGASYNNIVAAADVNEGATGVTRVTTGLGRSVTASGDVVPYAMYTQTGTAATTGKAQITIAFTGGVDIDGF